VADRLVAGEVEAELGLQRRECILHVHAAADLEAEVHAPVRRVQPDSPGRRLAGSFAVVGNNGTHTLNGAITTGTGAPADVLAA
jgi:hypothetical protein